MYIFGYFFQKGHFKNFLKKKTHQQKKFFLGGGEGGAADNTPAPCSGEPYIYIYIYVCNF